MTPRSPIDLDTIVSRNTTHLFSRMGDEVVIFDMPNNAYVGLDDIGAAVWDALDEPIRTRDLVTLLRTRFDGPPDAIAGDTIALLQRLVDDGIVTGAPAPTRGG